MARLKDMYKADVAPALLKKYEYKSVMQIPKLDKVIINVGVGDAKENSKAIDNVINDITLIAGQKAVPTYARKSVANFKLRQGMKIGVKVTLRGRECTNSWISCSPLHCLVSVTSRASIPMPSTAEEIMLWV